MADVVLKRHCKLLSFFTIITNNTTTKGLLNAKYVYILSMRLLVPFCS